MRSCPTAFALSTAGLLLPARNRRQDQAGIPSEKKVGKPAMVVPVDRTRLSFTPGTAPDNSQIEPRDPATR